MTNINLVGNSLIHIIFYLYCSQAYDFLIYQLKVFS